MKFLLFLLHCVLSHKHHVKYTFNENIEIHTQNFIKNHYFENKKIEEYDNISIPMIFHVVYSHGDSFYGLKLNEKIIQENVVDQLNLDYNLQNNDRFNTPLAWQHLMADFKINFFIRKIIYVKSNQKCETDNIEKCDDNVKYDSNGGSSIIDPELNLNVWIVLINPSSEGYIIQGYAYYASSFLLNREVDGYVLNINALNDRTSTHEIGHWMNLLHIWGEGSGNGDNNECSNDDYVHDTPVSSKNHIDCGFTEYCTYPETSSCGSPDMFMNYMSYGKEQYMFTKGQMLRARSIFEKGGTRYSIVTQNKDDAPKKNKSKQILYIIIVILLVSYISLSLFSYIKNKLLERNIDDVINVEIGENNI